MAYEMEGIRIAQSIFCCLLQYGSLSEEAEAELFKAYVENEDIMNLVKSQGEIAGCQVERYGSVIYMMPEISNYFLGYSKAELKRELCRSGATDKDYYLSQFIILTLLSEFYDGQGSRCKARDFIKMGELQNVISERLRTGAGDEEMKLLNKNNYERIMQVLGIAQE